MEMKTDTILEGLHLRKILAAGLDVVEEEPLEKANEFFREKLRKIQAHSNVIITPHIAGYSFEALYKMSKTLLNKIVTTR